MNDLIKLRLDKWLWAARFYKTRGLAKKAIETGKVAVDGQRPKPSKEITLNSEIILRQGFDEKTVIVLKLCEQRRGAPEAALMYQETAESIEKRTQLALQRKNSNLAFVNTEGRPSKKQRRQIHRFKEENN